MLTQLNFKLTSMTLKQTVLLSVLWVALVAVSVVAATCILAEKPSMSVSLAVVALTLVAAYLPVLSLLALHPATGYLKEGNGATTTMDMPKSGYQQKPADREQWLPDREWLGPFSPP